MRRRMWLFGGIGCTVVFGVICFLIVQFVLALFGFAGDLAGAVSPVPNGRAFLVALAEDDLETALSLATIPTETALQARLPSRLLDIAEVGPMRDFYSASNGSGWVEYRLTFTTGPDADVRLNMRTIDGEWRVTSVILVSGD